MEKIKLFCVSLGCDKNLVDTEKMLGVAGGLGVSFTDDETEALPLESSGLSVAVAGIRITGLSVAGKDGWGWQMGRDL
mgnify:CR=1 FL=1